MSAVNLLFLQNAAEKFPVSRVDRLFEENGFNVDYRWAYDEDMPDDLAGYDCIYLSESPYGVHDQVRFIEREQALIRKAAESETPMLGMCFGAQLLAAALFGVDMVFQRPECEVGYVWLDIPHGAADDPVFKDLGSRIRIFVWHNDEVRANHEGMTVYGRSAVCPNHMWRATSLPFWGVQGHPEVTRDIAPAWFEQNKTKLKRDGADIADLIGNPLDNAPAMTIFSNFMDVCRANAAGRAGAGT